MGSKHYYIVGLDCGSAGMGACGQWPGRLRPLMEDERTPRSKIAHRLATPILNHFVLRPPERSSLVVSSYDPDTTPGSLLAKGQRRAVSLHRSLDAPLRIRHWAL